MQTIQVKDWRGVPETLNRAEYHDRWVDARFTDVKRIAVFAKEFDQSICDEIDELESRLNEIKNKLIDDNFNSMILGE